MAKDFTTMITEIRALLEKQMRVKGVDLRTQTRRAGRRLPRRVRKDLAFLIETEKVAANPKLGRMINDTKVSKAHANVVAHLDKLNPSEAFWNMVLHITASVALALIVVFVVVVYLLWARGFV